MENTLVNKDLIFVSNKSTKVEVLKDVAEKLFEKKLVKAGFYENLIERELNYPTGIDLGVVNSNLPNIAVPHTEAEFVNARMIIPVHLNKEVEFNNMINPTQTLKVSFLFMILNNDPKGQSNILAQIMNFVTTTSVNKLEPFFKSSNKEVIYNMLQQLK